MKYEQIELTDEETREVTDYKTFGDDWVRRALLASKAKKYIDTYLEVVERTDRSCGRCCSSGTITYKRKNGSNITQDDVDAINGYPLGQETEVRGEAVGKQTAMMYWLCDSSD